MSGVNLMLGDCLDVLRGLPDDSVDSVVTDPPYGLSQHAPAEVLECLTAWIAGEVYRPKGKGFMGASWDAWVPGPEVWRECLRVLKPGGHVLAFAGTRSMDLMSMAIRLAGFELRDAIGYAHDGGGAPLLAWTFGSGFPKSRDVSKAIDSEAGAERVKILNPLAKKQTASTEASAFGDYSSATHISPVPATEAARQWQGWGTALKPAWEPIILARKPLAKGMTVAANVLAHGTGGLNIDGCRVGGESTVRVQGEAEIGFHGGNFAPGLATGSGAGRWPANLIHNGSDEVLAGFPQADGRNPKGVRVNGASLGAAATAAVYGGGFCNIAGKPGYADEGSAARFFYCAKASKKDRAEGLGDLPLQAGGSNARGYTKDVANGIDRNRPVANHHPTVKPTTLMQHLLRLVTPPGGTALDPFMGSGSTGKAARLEGFGFIGIERDPDYFAIAKQRIDAATVQAGLFAEEANV